MFFNMFVKQYSEFMGMPSDTTIEQLFDESNRLVTEDRKNYIAKLFADVKLKGLVTDMGYPVSKKLLQPNEIAEYDEDMVGYIDARLNRIEWVCEDILK